MRLALVWGNGPGDPCVMGHMGHGSRAQWVSLSDPFPALHYGENRVNRDVLLYDICANDN